MNPRLSSFCLVAVASLGLAFTNACGGRTLAHDDWLVPDASGGGSGGSAGHAGVGATAGHGGDGGTAGSGSYGGTAGSGSYGGTAGTGSYGGTAGTGSYGGTAGTGSYGGTAGTGGFGGTAGTGGFGGTAGTGGFGGTAGAGGFGGTGPLLCVPNSNQSCSCSTGESGVQVCSTKGTFSACYCPGPDEFTILAWYQAAIVGSWEGTATTPWTAAYKVRFVFTVDGHYSAHSFSPQTSTALYYCPDNDTPQKTYKLNDITAAKTALGRIVLSVPPDYGPMTDDIREMKISDDLSLLVLEIWHNGEYGPLAYDLHRVAP